MPHALSDMRHAPLGPRPSAMRNAARVMRHATYALGQAPCVIRPSATHHAPCAMLCAMRHAPAALAKVEGCGKEG